MLSQLSLIFLSLEIFLSSIIFKIREGKRKSLKRNNLSFRKRTLKHFEKLTVTNSFEKLICFGKKSMKENKSVAAIIRLREIGDLLVNEPSH